MLQIKNTLGGGKPEGLYAWKKLSAQGGDFISYVVNNDPNKYPSNGLHTDGYYYELFARPPVKIVTWADGTDAEIAAMVRAADKGQINLADYWSVGDERQVTLSAMEATGVGESHAEQTVTMVLMHQGLYQLVGGGTCNFIVGQKNGFATRGYMNSSNTNSGSWDGCARRTWCNEVYYNAIPETLRPIFKKFKTVTAESYNGTTNKISEDYFALAAEKEIFGTRTNSNSTEAAALTQFEYYVTESNRIKKEGDNGANYSWWMRSPYVNSAADFCLVFANGTVNTYGASHKRSVAPFGCI